MKLEKNENDYIFLSNHRDPRIRTTAVRSLELMCNDNRCLPLNAYRNITKLCDDTEKNVRFSALRIVLVFAEKYPEHQVKSARGFLLRLQDDAFSVVCHAINDLMPQVRAEAARLLGCFTSVSDSFLHQTLDKKLMRQMRMLNDGGISKSSNSGWSTGKKLGEDVPMEKDDEEQQSLIPTGACGAFITALEDEFMAVRQAAVYSLGTLAVDRQEFARLSIDHLADMFNDEIQEVRLDAIRALAPLISHGTLQQDQLYTILTVLDDANAENRIAVHGLIAKSNLADAECIKQCIKVLLHSLKRFPLDKDSIYKCLSQLGLRHYLFVYGLVKELLEIHPIFDTPEQDINDDFYLGKLILVLNAASKYPVICSLIPPYVKKHYRYLRCASRHLIPIVKEIEETKSLSTLEKMAEITDLLTKNTEESEENVVKTVKVIDPSIGFQNESTIRFVAGLPTGILVTYMLFNLSDGDLRQFKIQVKYPDQSITYFRPRPSDFHRFDQRVVRVRTTVVVSAPLWAEPATLELTCGFQHTTRDRVIRQKNYHFTALPDHGSLRKNNRISVRIHPMTRA